MKRPDWPESYPLSFERAMELVNGRLGHVYREIARKCMSPVMWFCPGPRPSILHSGTVTVVQGPSRIFGITAAHVLEQYRRDAGEAPVSIQILDRLIDEMEVIDSSEKRDLATINLAEGLVKSLGLEPLQWPPAPPTERRGIIMAGYPAEWRTEVRPMELEWKTFSAITTARTVTQEQVVALISREEWVSNTLPLNSNLGGISGGPIIGLFEGPGNVCFHQLSGIITEHPNYIDSDFTIERIAGTLADFISESGKIY